MIFQALQSEILRFKFYLLWSKIIKILDFNLVNLIINLFIQLKRGWIGEDGVHLHKSNAVHYWEENFQDIERQIKAKSKTQLSKSNPLLSN